MVLGATNLDLCPVAALYLAIRGQTSGVLFCLENRKPLKCKAFTASVQQALSSSSLVGTQFNRHSFRIGAATTASRRVVIPGNLYFGSKVWMITKLLLLTHFLA